MTDPSAYPKELERTLTLKDGSRVHIRPIRPDDAGRLVDLYARLGHDSAYQRFFTVMRRLPPDWAHLLANVDYERRLALVGEAPASDALIGVARYAPSDDGAAEVAFVVQDEWQNRGLGTALFHHLLAAGAARGISRFRAYVLSDNRRMLDMLTRFTDVMERTTDGAVTEMIFARRPAEPAPR
jgi:RimJ/RimL family protein N-acetyltransferase